MEVINCVNIECQTGTIIYFMAQMLLPGCFHITVQAIWAKYVRHNQWWTYQDGVRSCATSGWSKYDLMLRGVLKQATDFLDSEQGEIGGNGQQRLGEGTLI